MKEKKNGFILAAVNFISSLGDSSIGHPERSEGSICHPEPLGEGSQLSMHDYVICVGK